MDIIDLKKQITTNNLNHIYMFHGPEVGIRDIYVNKIKQLLDCRVIVAENYSSIAHSLTAATLFPDPKLYIIRDDKSVITENVKIDPGNNYILFIYDKIDKRSRGYKQNIDYIVEFELLPESVLVQYIQQQCDLSNQRCKELISLCSNDYSRVMLEIDKLKHYSSDVNHAFDIVKHEIYHREEPTIFEVSDAITKRNKDLCYKLCKNLNTDNIIGLIAILTTTFKEILQLQSCMNTNLSDDKLSNLTGIQKNKLCFIKQKCNYYSIAEIENILSLLLILDQGIKKGTIDNSYIINYLLACIL